MVVAFVETSVKFIDIGDKVSSSLFSFQHNLSLQNEITLYLNQQVSFKATFFCLLVYVLNISFKRRLLFFNFCICY
jgi:hypothetical protein